MRRSITLLLIVAGAAGAWAARDRLERDNDSGPSFKELLYLPDGGHLKVLSLGQAPLVADLIYLWAIQYYSSYDRADRHEFVETIFGDVISELDPHYVDAYWLGAMILSVEVRDPAAALRMLDRGIAHNPDSWILPYMAGWEARAAGDPVRAARYFEAAAGIEGAPVFIRRLGAGMYREAVDFREAIRRWEQVRDDPRSDAAASAIAQRWIRDLRIRLDVETLENAIETFRSRHDRYPSELEELTAAGLLRTLPAGPEGEDYGYDPATGRVAVPMLRVLGAR